MSGNESKGKKIKRRQRNETGKKGDRKEEDKKKMR